MYFVIPDAPLRISGFQNSWVMVPAISFMRSRKRASMRAPTTARTTLVGNPAARRFATSVFRSSLLTVVQTSGPLALFDGRAAVGLDLTVAPVSAFATPRLVKKPCIEGGARAGRTARA